jgi:NADH dehydrogenase
MGVDEGGVHTNAKEVQFRRIEAATKIWAAGVQASPLGRIVAEPSGVELDRGGRVKVEPDCTLPRHPEVFVIGDLMSLDQLPGVSQVAVQSGAHVAQTIIRRLAGEMAPRPFRYRDVGTMATVSRLRAVAVFGKVSLSGFPAWVVWLLVRLIALTGFKNRVSVLFNWTIAFVGRGRAQRVITRQQVFGRHALEAHARESGGGALPTSTPAHGKGATPLAS